MRVLSFAVTNTWKYMAERQIYLRRESLRSQQHFRRCAGDGGLGDSDGYFRNSLLSILKGKLKTA